MDEARWLRCQDPGPMLELVRDEAGDRKLRLFVVACCRRLWPLLEDERSRAAVDLTERFAEGRLSRAEWESAHQPAIAAHAGLAWGHGTPRQLAAEAAIFVLTARTRRTLADFPWRAVRAFASARERDEQAVPIRQRTDWYLLTAAERTAQADLVRCIFGNPFRAPAVDPYWLTWNGGSVAAMARSIHEDRSWEDMPFLGDALAEAGCEDEGLLAHCRAPVHARGCHLLDLLLGKE
jgi:hypothetical protein